MSSVQTAHPRHSTEPPAITETQRCCARHALRQGAHPADVAGLLGICAASLYEVLDYTPRRTT